MPTKTWEPPPIQSDTEVRRQRTRSAEPRNFGPPHDDGAGNPDSSTPERGHVDYEEINTHGSER